MLVAYFLLVVASLVSADEPVYSKCTGAGLTITSAKGHITSPNYPEKYPANQDCKWILKPPIGVSLRLRVDHLNNKEVFDGGDATCYDSLRISTGRKDEPFKYIDKGGLCAVTASDLSQDIFEIQNSENKTKLTKIEFASDYSDHLTGFSISFNALCNESLFGELGSFKSPGFPRSYPNNAECYFTIKTPVGTHIEIEFNTFRLEKLACETDYVIIGIGAADDINENKEKYCGYISPGSLRFPFHKITLLFVSGPDNSEQGFEATWKAVSADSPTTTVLPATTMPVAKNCSYTNTNKTCQRWDETYPHSPKHTPKDKNHNYCRNPDNDPRGYWCYTTDPDTRWEYCDFQNCIENNATTASINDSSTTDKSTTVNITTASEATTSEASTTANVKVVPKITGGGSEAPDITLDNGTVSAIQHVSPDASGLPWFVYLIGALCVLVILFILVFVWRRKRTKRQTLITDGTLENSVQFNQTQIALEDHKENTYVEIPYAGRPPRPKPRRNRNACEEFPEKRINDSCVTPRINEISVASLDNPASFASTSLQGQTSGFRNESYSISNDVGPSSRIASAVNKVLYNMAEEVDDVQVEENLYQTIELGDQEVIPSADEKVASPVTTITTAVKTSDSKQGSGKKLWKKPFLRMFGNQNETDRQKNTSRDNLSRENPFDTDDEEQQVSGPSKKQDSTESYSLSSGDRNPPSSQYHLSNKSVLENKTATQEFTDPIIVDPVTHSPLPDDASMICISPAIIDNNFEGEDNNIFIKDVLYSVPNPTSPEFPIEGFIYDVPVNTSRSNSESTKSDTHSPSLKGYEERDNSSTSESENNNSTPAYGLNGRQSQVEYCTMNSVPLLQKKHKKKQTRCSPPKNINKNRQENIRHSLLYTSMKENTTERHKSESKGKEVYENIAKPRQSL